MNCLKKTLETVILLISKLPKLSRLEFGVSEDTKCNLNYIYV